jgi:serine palmitoyltransferase
LQVAVVMVSFPATPLLLARARICISASHTKEDLVKALEVNILI